MFADSTNSITSALFSPAATLIATIIAAGVSMWANIKTNSNTADIEHYKSVTDKDLAHLNAKLAHGQLISTTQWNTEFGAYEALWKSFVPVRTMACKIVLREGELTHLGSEAGDVSEEVKIENIKKLLHQYATKSAECVAAINEHAPFYAADIRKKANAVHSLAHQVFQTNLALIVARQKGQSSPADAEAKRRKELEDLMVGIDALEGMIRERMNDVQVFNPAVV